MLSTGLPRSHDSIHRFFKFDFFKILSFNIRLVGD